MAAKIRAAKRAGVALAVVNETVRRMGGVPGLAAVWAETLAELRANGKVTQVTLHLRALVRLLLAANGGGRERV